MNIRSWLAGQSTRLKEAGVETARLDVLILLSDELGHDKSWCLAYPEHELQRSQIENLHKKIVQRAQHTPLAYIRGRAEFYGREFAANEHVLVPRPESEAMIELLKQAVGRREPSVVICDIGTGSGCLAITAKLEIPEAKVYATDIDPQCLQTAQTNAANLHAEITFLQGDLLKPLQPITYNLKPTTLLANLPYVPTGYPVNKAAAHEPKFALFSGLDGLGHYRKLFAQTGSLPAKPVLIITESLMEQHQPLTQIAAHAGYELADEQNLAQVFTVR